MVVEWKAEEKEGGNTGARVKQNLDGLEKVQLEYGA